MCGMDVDEMCSNLEIAEGLNCLVNTDPEYSNWESDCLMDITEPTTDATVNLIESRQMEYFSEETSQIQASLWPDTYETFTSQNADQERVFGLIYCLYVNALYWINTVIAPDLMRTTLVAVRSGLIAGFSHFHSDSFIETMDWSPNRADETVHHSDGGSIIADRSTIKTMDWIHNGADSVPIFELCQWAKNWLDKVQKGYIFFGIPIDSFIYYCQKLIDECKTIHSLENCDLPFVLVNCGDFGDCWSSTISLQLFGSPIFHPIIRFIALFSRVMNKGYDEEVKTFAKYGGTADLAVEGGNLEDCLAVGKAFNISFGIIKCKQSEKELHKVRVYDCEYINVDGNNTVWLAIILPSDRYIQHCLHMVAVYPKYNSNIYGQEILIYDYQQ